MDSCELALGWVNLGKRLCACVDSLVDVSEMLRCTPCALYLGLRIAWSQSGAMRKFRCVNGTANAADIRLVIASVGEDVITDANGSQSNIIAVVGACAHLFEKSLEA